MGMDVSPRDDKKYLLCTEHVVWFLRHGPYERSATTHASWYLSPPSTRCTTPRQLGPVGRATCLPAHQMLDEHASCSSLCASSGLISISQAETRATDTHADVAMHNTPIFAQRGMSSGRQPTKTAVLANAHSLTKARFPVSYVFVRVPRTSIDL